MTGRGALAARARQCLWRVVLTLTGGLRVRGRAALPPGPCVLVANHRSHADTAALIAALPARRAPAVAAAADYWFGGGRALVCRALCGAFPVRRSGGGSADLAAAARLLAAGRDVIVFPEGSRSRDGRTGEFHRGAARLAAAACVPLVPVGISGTGVLLPPDGSGGRPRPSRVTVRFGAPVCVMEQAERLIDADRGGRAGLDAETDAAGYATAQARARVVALLAE